MNDGGMATVHDARNYPKLDVKIKGYKYKAMSYFHTVDASDVKEVRECFPCSEYPKEWN